MDIAPLTYADVCAAHSRLEEATKRMLELRGRIARNGMRPDREMVQEFANLATLLSHVMDCGQKAEALLCGEGARP